MISGELTYNSVNVILVVTCLVSIALAFKLIPDKRSRTLFIVACILIVLAGIVLPFTLSVYRMGPMAHLSDAVGKSEGMRAKVDYFKDLALLGYVFEVVAIGLFVGMAKRLITLQKAEQSGAVEESGEEAQQ